MRQTDFDA
jgi:alanyl-tRNA synthetase